jgi:8-oxo-dGTP diphosphatase
MPGRGRAFLVSPDGVIHLTTPGGSHDDLHEPVGNDAYDFDAGWLTSDESQVGFFQYMGDQLEQRIIDSLSQHLGKPLGRMDEGQPGAGWDFTTSSLGVPGNPRVAESQVPVPVKIDLAGSGEFPPSEPDSIMGDMTPFLYRHDHVIVGSPGQMHHEVMRDGHDKMVPGGYDRGWVEANGRLEPEDLPAPVRSTLTNFWGLQPVEHSWDFTSSYEGLPGEVVEVNVPGHNPDADRAFIHVPSTNKTYVTARGGMHWDLIEHTPELAKLYERDRHGLTGNRIEPTWHGALNDDGKVYWYNGPHAEPVEKWDFTSAINYRPFQVPEGFLPPAEGQPWKGVSLENGDRYHWAIDPEGEYPHHGELLLNLGARVRAQKFHYGPTYPRDLFEEPFSANNWKFTAAQPPQLVDMSDAWNEDEEGDHGTGDHPVIWFPNHNLVYKGPFDAYHSDMYDGIPQRIVNEEPDPFHGRFDPGENHVEFYQLPKHLEPHMEGVRKALGADTISHSMWLGGEGDWDFTGARKTATWDQDATASPFTEDVAPWQPGKQGKGLVSPEGRAYAWQTTPEHDGYPSHEQALKSLGHSGFDQAFSDGWSFFSVNPDGTSEYMIGEPEHKAIMRAHLPQEPRCAGCGQPVQPDKEGDYNCPQCRWSGTYYGHEDVGDRWDFTSRERAARTAGVEVHQNDYEPWNEGYDAPPAQPESLSMIYDPRSDTLHMGAHDEVHHNEIWEHLDPQARQHCWPGYVSFNKKGYQFWDSPVDPMPENEKARAVQHLTQHVGFEPTEMGNDWDFTSKIAGHHVDLTPDVRLHLGQPGNFRDGSPIIADEDQGMVHIGQPGWFHGDVYDRMGGWGTHTRGILDEQKGTYYWLDTPPNAWAGQALGEAGYKMENPGWDFTGKVSEASIPAWMPGNHGKFVIDQGHLYQWATNNNPDRPEGDGDPSHGEYMSQHPDFGGFDYSDPNATIFGQGRTFGWITPDGLAIPHEKPVPAGHRQLIESIPGVRTEDVDWEGPATWDFASKTSGHDSDWGYYDDDEMYGLMDTMGKFEGTQGAGSAPDGMQHRPLMYDVKNNNLYIGAPGAYHQHLRNEFADQIGRNPNPHGYRFLEGEPNAHMEYGVLTPNNEVSWFGTFPNEDPATYEDNYAHATAINRNLNARALDGSAPGACPKCGGSGADYDASGGYYHDAQGACDACGGTGRQRQDETWDFTSSAYHGPLQLIGDSRWGPILYFPGTGHIYCGGVVTHDDYRKRNMIQEDDLGYTNYKLYAGAGGLEQLGWGQPIEELPEIAAKLGVPVKQKNSDHWDFSAKTADYDNDILRRKIEQQMAQGPMSFEDLKNLALGQQEYYYHYAPTHDRHRIQQHGLQPSAPAWSGWWDDAEKGSNPAGWIRSQPTGVYVTEDDSRFGPGNFEGPMDLWRIPREQVRRKVSDPLVNGAWVIQHPVQPELHKPYETTDRSQWDWSEAEAARSLDYYPEPTDQERKDWMIGRPTPKVRWRPSSVTAKQAATADGWTTCADGHTHWGLNGAAGLLLQHVDPNGVTRYLLQHRSPWVQHGNTYSTPGGALAFGESPEQGAHRESVEELGDLPEWDHLGTDTDDHGGWAYHTVHGRVTDQFAPIHADYEGQGHGWYTKDEINKLPLHPGFAAYWAQHQTRMAKVAQGQWELENAVDASEAVDESKPAAKATEVVVVPDLPEVEHDTDDRAEKRKGHTNNGPDNAWDFIAANTPPDVWIMKYNFGIDEKTALQILADPETRAIWERWKAQMPKEIVDPDPERLDPVDPMADSVWDFGNGGQGEGSHHAADQSAKKPQAGFSIQPRIGSAHHAKVEAAKSKREHRDSVPRHRHIVARGKPGDPYYDPDFPDEDEDRDWEHSDAAADWWSTVDPANTNIDNLKSLVPWQRGDEGKGILTSDGRVITWTNNVHHQQVAQLLPRNSVRAFLDWIHPDGSVVMDQGSTPEDQEAVRHHGFKPYGFEHTQWNFGAEDALV